MTPKPDGGHAFPTTDACEHGISMRDYFAAKAIEGKADHQGHHPNMIADAWAIADAMIAERDK